MENTIKYTKSCRIYHQISKYPPSFKYNSLFLPCKIIDGRVVTLTKCRYHICATAGVDPEKCILGWAGSLVIFYFTKCLNELPATCLYMRDPMDIFCKKCHIEEVTGLEIQVYSEKILFFFPQDLPVVSAVYSCVSYNPYFKTELCYNKQTCCGYYSYRYCCHDL